MKNLKLIFVLFLLTQLNFAQNKKVSGIVKDESGELFYGVVIEVKGTKNYTHTNFNGKFELNTEKNDKIIISFIGYEPIEIKIKDKTILKLI